MFRGRGTKRYPSNQALYFLSRRRTTILPHYRILHRQVPRSIVWIRSRRSRSSIDSQFCTSLLGELHAQLLSTSLSSSLVFVQEFPVAAAHLLLASTPFVLRMSLLLASNVVPCILGLSSFRCSVPLRRRRRPLVPPHHALSYAAGWLNQDGGEGEGDFFFRCNWDSCIRRGTWVVRG